MTKDKHWLTTLILQIKINSVPYVLKFIFFVAIIVIIHAFSDDFVTKVLSSITYTAGISIDAFFLNKQCSTNSRKLEVFIFFHMLLIWAGTVGLTLLLVIAAINEKFVESLNFCWYDLAVNLFVFYATFTPLLEAVLNSNGNQLTTKIEVNL